MGIISWIRGDSETAGSRRREPAFTNNVPQTSLTNLQNPSLWFQDWAGGGPSPFGPPITEQSSMRISTVFRCVNVLAGVIAGTPLNVYRKASVGGVAVREEAPNHRLAPMLARAPTPGTPLTSFDWRRQWAYNVLLWGNHFSIIRYDNAARVIGFEPVHPWHVQVIRLANQTNLYRCRREDGTEEDVMWDDMLHFKGPSYDGIRGLSRIQAFARTAVQLAVVTEEQSGRVHENAAKPSGIVSLPANISADGARRMDAFFTDRAVGRANAGKPLILENGQTWTQMQITPEDLNTVALRQFQVQEICRIFGVPTHIAFSADTTAWGSGIEQLGLAFSQYTLEPELQQYEHELQLKLFNKGPFFASFDREALTVRDAATAANVAQTEIQTGVLTVNEARAKKNRPPVPNGDTPLVNSTMISLKRAITTPPPPPAPVFHAPAPAPAEPGEPAKPAEPAPAKPAEPAPAKPAKGK